MELTYAVELRGITKIYSGSGKKANNNISLGLRKGEILCIAGENGAGKTTLMKILNGLETPSSGEIFINGNAVIIGSTLTAQKMGIGMVHQHFLLFPEYTVAENIVMGVEPCKWGIFIDGVKAKAEAARVIEAHHFSIKPDRIVQSLSIGEMQQVEICRLLYRNADIIILDEPTSVLTEHETAALFKTLKTLAHAGKSIFLITHKLQEIKCIADRVAVLRRGELVGIYDTNKIDEYAIAQLMIGNTHSGIPQNCRPKNVNAIKNKNPVIVFDDVSVLRRGQQQPLLDKVSFNVKPGEILGFAGVGGNGLGVLEAVLGGFLHPASGSITHNDNDISRLNIRRLRNQGLAYIPADRLRVGSAPGAAVFENIIINRRHELTRKGFLDQKAINAFSAEIIKRFNIEIDDKAQHAATLSGGNLQKLILAREIDQFRDYFVFSEPSWGLDMSASAFIWDESVRLRDKGAAIILISTNLDEILGLADRIIVMYRGRAAAEFASTSEADLLKEKIGACMQGLLP
ncbi:MAG: ATP-binding cassette domain-containing protein [Treponema sp.]|jgi:simple sugar transport system ATP-binding protein|nr:ATP-binding cassette domain-containing protein [Treponema sp.]